MESAPAERELRVYTVRPGEMDAWLAEWREKIRPLREKLGFRVVEVWTSAGGDRFIWLLEYAGAESFDAADAAYYSSAERKSIQPDPARHLLNTEHHRLKPVRG
jgi:hypothetical protein